MVLEGLDWNKGSLAAEPSTAQQTENDTCQLLPPCGVPCPDFGLLAPSDSTAMCDHILAVRVWRS